MSDDSAGFAPIEPTPVVPATPAADVPVAQPVAAPPLADALGTPPAPAHPQYPAQPAYGAQPGYPPQPQQGYQAQPGYPPQPSGYAPPPYSPNGYASPGYPAYYGAPVPPRGLSIASMVLGIVGVLGITLYGIGIFPGIAAVITGHIAQKKQPHGKGFWLTGIITGYAAIVLSLIVGGAIVALLVWTLNNPSYTSPDY